MAGAAVSGGSGTDTAIYTYDALDRIVGISVDGASQSVGYDALSRVNAVTNPLDTFTYSYSDGTPRLTGASSNNGPTLAMTYYGATGDEQLQQMTATQGGTTLAQFGYQYNANDNVTSFNNGAQTLVYSYDAANRLHTGTVGGTAQYDYEYDNASNLTSITANGTQSSYSYTNTNAIMGSSYDLNGSPTALGGKTYIWDGANQLVSSSNGSTTSTFTYNGLGRVVRIVDSVNGTVTADHSYFWCGDVRCLARDNTESGSPISTRYYDQGAIIGGTSYYYVRDLLGSVRTVVSGGAVAAQYDYDPYGNSTTLSGSLVSDVGYTGYFYHAASGLAFALNRAYDPSHGRWLNRDTTREAGGANLYGYVSANPLSLVDPRGLAEACEKGPDEKTKSTVDTFVNWLKSIFFTDAESTVTEGGALALQGEAAGLEGYKSIAQADYNYYQADGNHLIQHFNDVNWNGATFDEAWTNYVQSKVHK